jgi:hypothetical protein
MSYQDELKYHLAEFKRFHLGIAEPGLFRFRGRNLEYHHILPAAHALANLLLEAEPAAKAFLAANPRKRHRYFHHLNSSQAFAFNLFFPYFSGVQVVIGSTSCIRSRRDTRQMGGRSHTSAG